MRGGRSFLGFAEVENVGEKVVLRVGEGGVG